MSFLKSAFSGLRQFLATENPLKMMKMLFISPYNLFSFSRYLNFCLDFFVGKAAWLERSLISKFTMSKLGNK